MNCYTLSFSASGLSISRGIKLETNKYGLGCKLGLRDPENTYTYECLVGLFKKNPPEIVNENIYSANSVNLNINGKSFTTIGARNSSEKKILKISTFLVESPNSTGMIFGDKSNIIGYGTSISNKEYNCSWMDYLVETDETDIRVVSSGGYKNSLAYIVQVRKNGIKLIKI